MSRLSLLRGRQELPLFRALIGGFALLIALLATSVYIEVAAMRSTESDTARLLEGQRATLRLIEDVQRDEDSLSAVFYALAAGTGAKSTGELLNRLDKLETAIQATIAAGLASGNAALWSEVKSSAARFISEGRTILTSGKLAPLEFYRAHEALINALGDLAASHFDSSAAEQKTETEGANQRVRFSMILLAAALVIALIGTILTVRVVSRMFQQLQFQTEELSHLSSRTMADQEATARRFSREMHDEFGQNLSAIEANLVAMQNARQFHETRMEDCLALVKQAIANTRELSQLLRPSVLDDFGLDASLRWIADGFSQRTGIKVEYHSTLSERLPEETETQLFRIFQEALTNVSRHATATLVRVDLRTGEQHLTLTVADNGKGFLKETPAGGGLGLVGMRARARALHGSLSLASVPNQGVTIAVEIPFRQEDYGSQNSHSAG